MRTSVLESIKTVILREGRFSCLSNSRITCQMRDSLTHETIETILTHYSRTIDARINYGSRNYSLHAQSVYVLLSRKLLIN